MPQAVCFEMVKLLLIYRYTGNILQFGKSVDEMIELGKSLEPEIREFSGQ
jgi:hypothetical protein